MDISQSISISMPIQYLLLIALILFYIFLIFRYHYIESIHKTWNKKLNNYIFHKKKFERYDEKSINYFSGFYLYNVNKHIYRVFKWREKDFINDKLLLDEVNKLWKQKR